MLSFSFCHPLYWQFQLLSNSLYSKIFSFSFIMFSTAQFQLFLPKVKYPKTKGFWFQFQLTKTTLPIIYGSLVLRRPSHVSTSCITSTIPQPVFIYCCCSLCLEKLGICNLLHNRGMGKGQLTHHYCVCMYVQGLYAVSYM